GRLGVQRPRGRERRSRRWTPHVEILGLEAVCPGCGWARHDAGSLSLADEDRGASVTDAVHESPDDASVVGPAGPHAHDTGYAGACLAHDRRRLGSPQVVECVAHELLRPRVSRGAAIRGDWDGGCERAIAAPAVERP